MRDKQRHRHPDTAPTAPERARRTAVEPAAEPLAERVERLVQRLGRHPATEWGIDLAATGAGGERALGRWLVGAVVLGSVRGDPGRAGALLAALVRADLADPPALARAAPTTVASTLARAGDAHAPDDGGRRALALGARLVRAGGALEEGFDGSLERLATSADGLEELGARVAGLAPGIGAGTVVRFLRPLRERWPLADEIPLSPAARAAAMHLGWLRESEDEEGPPGALRRSLAAAGEAAPPFRDVEAALDRLGARACLRGRVARCPLGAACPARERDARPRAASHVS